MSFVVAQQTLESLEWTKVVERLHAHCRTPLARSALAPEGPEAPSDDSQGPGVGGWGSAVGGFEQTLAGTRERLAETTEARAILDTGELPPLHGVTDIEAACARAEKGGVLEAGQLLGVRATLEALHASAKFVLRREEAAPRLAEVAELIDDQAELERAIGRCIDPSGEVRDEASSALAEARSQASQLGGELQRRLERYLQNSDISPYLSDSYYTLRNDRYVLPVKADFRGRVRGIVHDASNSGTTLFIEPEAVVELNNRLKQCELTAAREILRVLQSLSQQLAEAGSALRSGLKALTHIDLAFARGHLSMDMDAVEPRVERDGVFELRQLRHPLLPVDEAVANDISLGQSYTTLVLSGPNAGGKTVAMKSVGLATLLARTGMHLPADSGARLGFVDTLLADIGDGQDIGESLSTFSAHMSNLAGIVDSASEHSLVLLDEVGVGTDPGEGAALAQAVLETLAEQGCRVIATTHYNLLKEMADVETRFCNASVEFDPETLAPTYKLHMGTPGASSATAVAARMGMPSRVLDRANALLDREDRRLDRMLSELGASRAALDEEQRRVTELRAEGESVRAEYRGKLERLNERRDKLFHSMRDDLDVAFKQAHEQIAEVIRELQRGGSATAQQAAQARERLLALESETLAAEETASDANSRAAPQVQDELRVNWREIRAGDRVRVPGGGTGLLESLPDRHGRVRVRVGSAQLSLAADLVSSVADAAKQHGGVRPTDRQPKFQDVVAGGGTLHCDLRGLRVDEALDQLAEQVDRALAEARDELRIVHGLGTGALRRAVRSHLAASPHVFETRPGDSTEGGDGLTVATLGRR